MKVLQIILGIILFLIFISGTSTLITINVWEYDTYLVRIDNNTEQLALMQGAKNIKVVSVKQSIYGNNIYNVDIRMKLNFTNQFDNVRTDVNNWLFENGMTSAIQK